ncbi:MAG: calcium-binding protein, partial [Rhodobacteraceae bacterium]|nr:calcium-binding protein [Paracoccaceae bacterium]
MATLITGLGGTAGFGEQSIKTTGLTTGSLDDGSRTVDITSVFGPSGLNFFGTNFTNIFINTNGFISFAGPVGTPASFTPTTSLTSLATPVAAAFWTDINIGASAAADIYWDLDTTTGKVTITWANVPPFSGTGTNSFQIVLSNLGGGDLGIDYIYGSVGFTGSGGGVATVGLSNGTTELLAEGSSNAAFLSTYATNDFDTSDAAGVFGVNFEGGTLQHGDGIVDGTAGNDVINGSYAGDLQGDLIDNRDATGFSGTTGQDDYIRAGAGNDSVTSGEGNDRVFGDAGNDSLFGGYGSDTLDGGTESDSIDGGSGNDVLIGGDGNDTLVGGTAAAATTYTAAFTEITAAHQAVTGTSGRSNFFVRTTSGDADLTFGTSGAVSGFQIGNGDRVETHTHQASSQLQSGQIIFNGIDGNETLTIILDGTTINLNTAIANGTVTFSGGAGTYAIDAGGNIIRTGGGAATTITGTLTINIPYTTISLASAGTTGTAGIFYEYYVNTVPLHVAAETGGDDSLSGLAGNDVLFGGAGNDTL